MTYLKGCRGRVSISLILQCHHLHLEHHSRLQRLWLRHLRELRMTADWIRTLLAEIADYFRPIRDEALESGLAES